MPKGGTAYVLRSSSSKSINHQSQGHQKQCTNHILGLIPGKPIAKKVMIGAIRLERSNNANPPLMEHGLLTLLEPRCLKEVGSWAVNRSL